LIAGSEGNVSARLDTNVILATTAGVCKGDIDESHVVALTGDGRALDPHRIPSTEIRMHLALYARRPDVAAVVHAHPPTATGFAVAGEDFMAPVLPELVYQVGPVPLVPYGQPGTDELPDRLAPFADGHEAFLLANHGVTTVGRSLDEALHRMESLEQGARIILAARQLGRVNELPPESAAALRALRIATRGAQ
jgi:L-fuculose-phosphate aldolase